MLTVVFFCLFIAGFVSSDDPSVICYMKFDDQPDGEGRVFDSVGDFVGVLQNGAEIAAPDIVNSKIPSSNAAKFGATKTSRILMGNCFLLN
jgi:hypothetical protein